MGRPARERGPRPLCSPARGFQPPQYRPPQLRPPATKPKPANDNSPFRPRRPGGGGGFGRRPPSLGRRPRLPRLGPLAGLIGGGFAVYNYLNPPVSPKPAQWPDWDQSGYRIEYGPWPLDHYKSIAGTPTPFNWLLNPLYRYTQVDPIKPTTGSVTAPGTNGVTSPTDWWVTQPLRGRFYYGSDRFQYSTGELLPDRQYWHSSWVRTNLDVAPAVSPNPGAPFRPSVPYQPYPLGLPNPNWVRNLPGQRPGTTPHPQAPPNPGEVPAPAPPAPLPPDPRPGVPFPSPRTDFEQAANDVVGGLIGGSPPHARQPPRRNERENKNQSRAAKLGIAGFRALDTFSELSEIGQAFWDALPEEVKKAARCRTKNLQIGQYGAAINKCQLRAIINNWDKIDTNEAWKNIAKNLVEDMSIGEFHRWLAKAYPPGISFKRTAATHALSQVDPEAYISARLKELWEFLGV